MGPTTIALVKLYQADLKLRDAVSRLDAATKNVRIQQRRVSDLAEKAKLTQHKLMELKSKSKQLELDLAARDAHIEKLRTQQQLARNNKEYQAFLVEINTHKVDRGKIETEGLKILELSTAAEAELKMLVTSHESESTKLQEMQGTIDETTVALRAEVDDLRIPRDAAHAELPANPKTAYDRLASRFDGEALSAISKTDPRIEQYTCTACMIDLVRDVYNRLHSSNELIFCRSCGRILYIPEDLPPEVAVHRPKEPKEPKKPRDEAEPKIGRKATARSKGKPSDLTLGADAPRQSDAVSVMNSIGESASADPPDETSDDETPST